jgi:phosphopantetheinyl transferase
MACHFSRWAISENEPDTRRLSADLVSSTLAFSPKRRQRFLHSRALLGEMMFYLYGMNTLPKIITAPNGRPCFAESNLPDFSLAYAGNTTAVMLSSEGKVGLDIEVIRARSGQITQRQNQFLTPAERAWIDAQIDPLEAATQLWCIRQSVLKLAGLGTNGLDTLRLHPASGRLRSTITQDVQVMSDTDNLIAWGCAHTPTLARLVLWNYHPEQGFTRTQDLSIQQQSSSNRYMKFTSLPPTK